jgi:hypothetical protein
MNRRFRRLLAISVAFLTACTPVPQDATVSRAAQMQDSLPPMRVFAEQGPQAVNRPNSEIARDFMDLAFRMESGRPIPTLTRFEQPISVRVAGEVAPSLIPDLRRLVNRLRNEAKIDIFLTGAPEASITVQTVPMAELHRLVPRAACFVVPRVSSWEEFKEFRRTPQVDWTAIDRRDRAAVFIPADAAPQEIRDCLHEEMSQVLGPLNDLYRLPDSVFNDDNINAVLTGFDMLILRAYYDPALRNGMQRGEVAGRLPAILARLNPAGEYGAPRPLNDTPRDWINDIETAMSTTANPSVRLAAAEHAVNLSRANGWTGSRAGFSLYVYGRLQTGRDANLAYGAFVAADRAYRQSPETRLHSAHVAVQLAAYSLGQGDAYRTLQIATEAMPIAMQGENAALLATLGMFKAEALTLLGRDAEAQAARLDSLGWARYGFGSESNVRAREREIHALAPKRIR